MFTRYGPWLSGLLCAAFAAGCGDGSMGTVEGRVTLDGQPVKGAVVYFHPKGGGRPSMAITDEDGYYELRYTTTKDGAAVGEHVVRITTEDETEDEQGNPVAVPERLPARYNYQSELVREVQPGSNTFDFPLESGGPVGEPESGAGEEVWDDC